MKKNFEIQIGKCMLICMVGLPYSGKTTMALRELKGFPIVNRDAIRMSLHGKRYDANLEDEVTKIEDLMVSSLRLSGHDKIIIDACHLKVKRLDRWMAQGYHVYSQFVLTPLEECHRRAILSGDSEIKIVINRMASESDMVDYHVNRENPIVLNTRYMK